MALLVKKFGGTSVGSPERIRSVAQRIARYHQQGHQLVVVVSAMGDATDELIALAHRVSASPPHREMDMLLTVGERISMALLSMALGDLQVPAVSLTGSQSGIITDGSHRRARIRRILGDRIRGALAAGKVVIVAGFQGVSEAKEITTLGRGGSDTTAVALAVALKADLCDIYTDVDGVYSADPRIVPEARLWKALSANLMVEMAARGAGVLHPRSVELAKHYGLPLRVLNSLSDLPRKVDDKGGGEGDGISSHPIPDFASDAKGTIIMKSDRAEAIQYESSKNEPKGEPKSEPVSEMEKFALTAVTADKSKILVRVELMHPNDLAQLWQRASQTHLSVQTPSFLNRSVLFFTDNEGEKEWEKILQELMSKGIIHSFDIDSRTVPLSVVGDRFGQDGLVWSQVIQTLAKNDIPVAIGNASSLAITVGVPVERVEDGIRALHTEFLAC